MNRLSGKVTDNVTKTVHDLSQRSKHLVAKTHFAELFPYLLNRIHLRRVWRKEYEFYVFRYTERSGFVPGSTVTA